jgi:hypothetical protein
VTTAPTPSHAALPDADAVASKLPLDKGELMARLTISSPELVKELYETTLRQIQSETERQTRLDAKATVLLAASGVSLTVAVAIDRAIVPSGVHSLTAFLVLGLASALGLSAALCALMALRVRVYMGVNDDAVFNKTLLAEADNADDALAGLTEYRKSMIVHLWLITQRQATNRKRKASLVALGQRFFLAFFVSAFCLYAAALYVRIH